MWRRRFLLLPKRIYRLFLRLFLQVPNAVLDRLECRLAAGAEHKPLPYPPVFIIGAPRSGSTLLFQALVNRFDFGYLSNVHCQCYGAPSVAQRCVRQRWRQAPPVAYESVDGRSNGWFAPSECGPFWYRFFRREPNYVPLEDVAPRHIRRLRRAIWALSTAFGRPVLFKNIYCSMRLAPIAAALPEAVFIVIRRDEIANAHSLLEGRKRVHGTYHAFWGVKPPHIAFDTLPPHAQVIEQIRQVYRQIEHDKYKIGSHRFVDVCYESFCADTHETLARLEEFFAEQGLRLEKRRDIPAHFPIRHTLRIDPELYEQVKEYARNGSTQV